MKKVVTIIYLSFFLLFYLKGQDVLVNFFNDNSSSGNLTIEEQIEVRIATQYIINKYNIKLDLDSDCQKVQNSLNINEIRQEVREKLKNKISLYPLSDFLSSSYTEFNFCNFIKYFINDSNGLSLQEITMRNKLSEDFGLEPMSAEGKTTFYQHYKTVLDSIYRFEGVVSKEFLRVDTIKSMSRKYFNNKLSIIDNNVLDSFWNSKCTRLFSLWVSRDSIHEVRIKILKSSIDSIEQYYYPILEKERDSITKELSEIDRDCLIKMQKAYKKAYENKRLYNWDRDAIFYSNELPNYTNGLSYIYNLLLKYPSSIYARSMWNYNPKCNVESLIKNKNYMYIEFEKSLNTIIDKYYPNVGMIYYSPYNKYTENDIISTINNMLMYYLK